MSAVQTYLPRRAFDALDIPLVVKLARLAGVGQPRIESSTYRIPSNIPAGSTRVTSSLEMALELFEAFKQQALRAEKDNDGDLVVATANAVAALLAAIDEYRRPHRASSIPASPY